MSLAALDSKQRQGSANIAMSGKTLAQDVILVRIQTKASAGSTKIENVQSKKAYHKFGALLNAQEIYS